MDMSMQPRVLEDGGNPKPSSLLEISLDGKTRRSLEAIAEMEGEILSELVTSMLAASMSPAADDSSHGEEEEIGDEWEKLTNEILRLESILRKVIQLSGEQTEALSHPTEHLQRLVEDHDRKITECEEKLENLMAMCRRRSPVCGILADYYDR